MKVAEQTTVDYRDGVLRIDAPAARNQYLGPSGSVEVTVQLPTGSRIEGKAAFAEFRGVGRFGDVALEAYGVVKIDEVASTRLTAYAGDVEVGRLSGPAEISTQQGDIQIDESMHGPADGRRYEWEPTFLLRRLKALHVEFTPIEGIGVKRGAVV